MTQTTTQNGWIETVLGEVANIFDSKRIPLSTVQRQKRQGKYPYYGASNIVDHIDDYIFDGEYLLISEDGENLNTRNTPIAFIANGKFWVNNHAHILQGKSEHITKYLCWYFSKLDISPYITGAVQPKLSKTNLLRIPIFLPRKEKEQRAITAILSSFDKKIELLHGQNETLKATTQIIFREWIGRYSVNQAKKLPEEWRVGKLVDLSEHVKDSTSPCESSNKLFSHYSIPAFDQGGKPEFVKGAEILSNKYIVKDYSFLVSKLNPETPRIWMIFKADKTSVCSTEFQVIKPKDIKYFSFVYSVLNSVEFIRILASKAHGTSSSHQRVSPKDILEVEIVIPNDLIMQEYQNLVFPVLAKLDQNKSQIQTLSSLRDTLLPKLMQGEIRIKNI